MLPHHQGPGPSTRAGWKSRGALFGSVLLAAGMTGGMVSSVGAAGAAGAAGAPTGNATPHTVAGLAIAGFTDPTAGGHTYRHGAVPRIIPATPSQGAVPSLTPYPVAPGSSSAAAQAGGTGQSAMAAGKKLTYGGGLTAQGVGAVGSLLKAGVTTGPPRVYLVFYGGQWGTEGTNGSGQATFSGDPDAEAPVLQTFFSGLGTSGELWSGTVTQYCDGVTVGATACTAGSQTIPYPTGHVLAGVWYDNSSAATSAAAAGATGGQLATEAEAAAVHFGNLDQASNRNTQYVIASPHGSNVDGWLNGSTGYCAYHDDTHDPTIDGSGPAPGPILAFTNMPYVSQVGSSCGAGTVNTPGTLDGTTEAASHEYGETLTDQFPESTPPGGWTNSAGAEIGDLCAYISAPLPGAAYNLTLATGTVAVQGLWSNAANGGKGGCVQSSPVFGFPPKITSFAPKKAQVGAWVTIIGANLSGATQVAFNGAPASILSDTPTTVVVRVPPTATNGTITVTNPGGTATSAKSFLLAPTVTGFTPPSGPVGTSVTITGTGLGGAKKVSFNGRKASVVSDTGGQIVALVPARATTGPIAVKTAAGTASSASAFTVT